MRILHVLRKLDRGGVETWLIQVLRHIDRQKYQMDFLVHTTDPGAYDEEVRALGARIIPCLNPSNPLQYAFNFRRVLREHGPYDVVHSHVHHYSGYVLMLAAMAEVKVRIAHSHTSAPELSPGIVRRAYLAAMRHLIKRRATLGIAISTLAGDSLMAGWQKDPSWYLRPYGIETKPFDTKVDSIAVRKELGLPPEALVVGHVGRFVDVKNHKFIIQVASELVKWDSNVVFLLVGDGPMRSEVETELSDCGLSKHFVLIGSRHDIPRIMKGAMDAFVFPSKYEGLGIVLMEAQFAGLCSVVSDVVPPETDLIDNAVIRLPLSVPSIHWAKSLRAILEARRHCSTPDCVRKQHSISESVSQLTALYDSRYCDLPMGSAETNNDLIPVEQK
jgi:glycosyltransferase involved in cell wall biosynthesis